MASPALTWAKLEYVVRPKDWNFGNENGLGDVETIGLSESKYRVGRSASSDLRVAFPYISNRHCVIFTNGEPVSKDDSGAGQGTGKKVVALKAYVQDLKSSNGTFVNGQEMQKGATKEIRSGDIIALSLRTTSSAFPFYRFEAVAFNESNLSSITAQFSAKDDIELQQRLQANENLASAHESLRQDLNDKLQEILELKIELNQFKSAAEECKTAHRNYDKQEQEIRELKKLLKSETNRAKSLALKVEGEDEKRKSVSLQSKDLEKKLSALESKNKNVTKKLEEEKEKNLKLTQRTKNFETLLEQRKQLEETIGNINAAYEKLQKEADLAASKLVDKETEIKTLRGENDRLNTEHESLNGTMTSHSREIKVLSDEIKSLKRLHLDYKSEKETEISKIRLDCDEERIKRLTYEERLKLVLAKSSQFLEAKSQLNLLVQKLEGPSRSIQEHLKKLNLPKSETVKDELAEPTQKAEAVNQEGKTSSAMLKRKRTVSNDVSSIATMEALSDDEQSYDSSIEVTQKADLRKENGSISEATAKRVKSSK
mmetsp:Transcript_6945/g.9026  ORF Transcript_6945/g.9026 Transcript_6945/m.9026 type:complete len:542 (+) Transcript_6945:157-1782(+)